MSGPSSEKSLNAQLDSVIQLTPSVRSYRFTVDSNPSGQATESTWAFVTGQWVNLWLHIEGEWHRRAYSIACSSNYAPSCAFDIAVTRVEEGVVSNALCNLSVGDNVRIDGPHGFFTRNEPIDQPLVFVGTGTGLSPLRALIQEELERNAKAPVQLLFGCRDESEILWRGELEELAKRHARFHYDITLSRAPDSWLGRRGYVQDHLEQFCRDRLLRPTANSNDGHDNAVDSIDSHIRAYVCGRSEMVKSVRAVLKNQLHLDRKSIHTERFD